MNSQFIIGKENAACIPLLTTPITLRNVLMDTWSRKATLWTRSITLAILIALTAIKSAVYSSSKYTNDFHDLSGVWACSFNLKSIIKQTCFARREWRDFLTFASQQCKIYPVLSDKFLLMSSCSVRIVRCCSYAERSVVITDPFRLPVSWGCFYALNN